MAKEIILKNKYLEVKITDCGAEMTSVCDSENMQYIHQKNQLTWDGQAPVLFPVCGHMAKKQIVVNKKIYDIPLHGFAKDSVFEVLSHNGCEAEFLLVSNDQTRKMYPYDFSLLVGYRLEKRRLEITYEVTNEGEKDMFFSIGSHEGYVLKDGLDGCEIIFEKKEEKPYYFEEHSYDFDGFSHSGTNSVLELCGKLFEESKTIVFEKIKSDSAVLKDNSGKTLARIEFGGFDNLFIWTCPNSDFICIEPWCGMAEYDILPEDISLKPYIQKLKSKERFKRKHAITFGE